MVPEPMFPAGGTHPVQLTIEKPHPRMLSLAVVTGDVSARIHILRPRVLGAARRATEGKRDDARVTVGGGPQPRGSCLRRHSRAGDRRMSRLPLRIATGVYQITLGGVNAFLIDLDDHGVGAVVPAAGERAAPTPWSSRSIRKAFTPPR